MPRLQETLTGRRFFQNTMPKLAENLDRIITQMVGSEEQEKVFILVGVCQGAIDDVAVTLSHDRATEIENDLCAKYGVPANLGEREEYYEKNPEPNEVRRFEVELE